MDSGTPLDIANLYRRHLAMVRGRALRILGNAAAADDVAQEVFIHFLQSSGRGASALNPAAFLYRMATNAALNRLRDSRRRHALQEARLPEPSEHAPFPEDWIALRQVLTQVDEEVARIATYYYFDGLEQEEIAELLSLQRRTVGRRLEAFRDEARRLLGHAQQGGVA